MNDETQIDRIRALVEGRLGTHEAARLEREIAADPELAEIAETFREVHSLTEVALGESPATALRFETVVGPRRSGDTGRAPIRRLWPAAAAAAVLVAATLGGYALMRPSGPASLALQAIPLAEVDTSAPEAAVPAALAEFQPVSDGEVQWFTSLEEGRAAARLTGRPVLVYLSHPECPLCVEMKAKTFTDGQVTEIAERFVPVQLNVMKVPPAEQEEARAYLREGWPFLGVQDAEGAPIRSFPGMHGADSMRQKLEDGIEASGAGDPISWKTVNRLTVEHARAKDAEKNGRLGDAAAGYRGLTEADPDGEFGRLGAAGTARIAADARWALLEARERAATDVEGAAADLDDAAKRFAGTGYAGDLEKTARLLRERGVFPELTEEGR